MTREERLVKYLEYRDRAFKNKTFTREEEIEYKLLESEFNKTGRLVVKKTEADTERVVGNGSQSLSTPGSYKPLPPPGKFEPVVKTNEDFIYLREGGVDSSSISPEGHRIGR